MAEVIRCQDTGRLQLLRDQTPADPADLINGIDFLVVGDAGEVPTRLRQRVLLLRFVHPLTHTGLDSGLGGTHLVRIRGGQRVVDPSVRWMSRLASLDAGTVDPELAPDEVDFFDALALTAGGDIDHWLVVVVDRPGDHSYYRLSLRAGDDPPDGFDRVLSEIDFSFKVECPSPFDCLRATPCTTPGVEAPELDYLSRDFASFRRLMFDRLALIAPDDLSRDPATLRAAIVEALAYEADRLAYFQDAVATETYLTTARTRPSIRRHGRLLGHALHEGCNARAFVQLTVDDGVTVGGTPVRVGCQLLTRVPEAGPVVGAEQLGDALAHAPEAFEVVLAPVTIAAAHQDIAIHTWGNRDCCLPAGATELWLVDDGLSLAEGDLLVIEQTHDPVTGLRVDADPTARHVVRLSQVDDAVDDDLMSVSVRRVVWNDDDALPFPLVVNVGATAVATAGANLVLVDHGASVVEPLVIDEWGNQGRLRATLGRAGLTWRHLDDDELPGLSASGLLRQDPRRAVAEASLRGEGETWRPRRDLLRSPASAPEFVVEMESDGRARVRFGDDVMGRRPTRASVAASTLGLPVDASGQRFSITYRVGNGPGGNVGAGAIAHVVADPDLVDAALVSALRGVANPLPASGGAPPETITEARRDAPEAYRVQERAVTVEDWIEVTERHPRVQRARARLHWTGSWHTVVVTADPVAGVDPEQLRSDLVGDLDRYRLAGYDLAVRAPTYVPLDISLFVCAEAGAFRDQVELGLREEFTTGHLADGRRGFFHPDHFSFGDSVWLSQVVARAMEVPGVRYVDLRSSDHPTRFRRRGRPQGTEIDDGLIRIGESEIARCDNDPNAPESGTIGFFVEGGS